MIPVSGKAPVMDEILLSCMRALGLAGLSGVARTAAVMTAASQRYVTAIHATNAALQSPTQATEDRTLLAVMMLGVFETVLGTSQSSLEALTSHINGSASLLNLRGPQQLQTVMGKWLFMQALSLIMSNCLRLGLPLPGDLWVLNGAAKKAFNVADPQWRFLDIMMQVTDLQSDIISGRLAEPRRILARAQELDTKLEALSMDFPPDWQFRVVTVDAEADPNIFLDGHYHVPHHGGPHSEIAQQQHRQGKWSAQNSTHASY